MIVEDTARERVRFADTGGGIEIAYESFGDPSDPTILLVMGLGMQMLGWDEGFCELLVDRGYRVVRYDNRDIGLSTKIGGGTPNVLAGAALGVGVLALIGVGYVIARTRRARPV